MEVPGWVTALSGIFNIGSLVGWLVNRRHQRRDSLEDQRVNAYRSVLAALGFLRSTATQLDHAFDIYNMEPTHSMFDPTNEAITKAFDAIEHNRGDTGDAFAEAARDVVGYWKELTIYLWEKMEKLPDPPTFTDREAALRETVPRELRARVNPGYL